MLFPTFVLQCLWIEPLSDISYLRFVGAFVFSVGTLYMLPLFDKTKDIVLLISKVTAILRINIFLFLIVTIALNIFDKSWLLVAFYDLFLACFQAFYSRKFNNEK
ncbi:MAG: hypothetical protein COB02_11555 [Candidatus Cloacimonadota bacterium]|nr:MAG: hypothetical protein COB02_11555 [Candidatus Cloacimonadota bacterium]